MTSGWMPDSEKGMSMDGHFCEQTPFCPWREENLSPMMGERGTRNLMLIFWQGCVPSSEPMMRTSSTKASSSSLYLKNWVLASRLM